MDNTSLLNDFDNKINLIRRNAEHLIAIRQKTEVNAEKWHRKAVDSERIDKAIAEASELAQIEINGLRLLHKSQMQLLEAQQQNRRIKELYKKFFS